MFKQVETDDVCVCIDLDRGYFGDKKYTAKQAYSEGMDIKKQIIRHVDGCGQVYVQQKTVWEDSDGDIYDSLYEALESQFSEQSYGYNVHYVRPSDNGIGSTRHGLTWQELVTTAYQNPFEFKVTRECPKLTTEQEASLNNVIDAGKKRYKN